MKGLFLNNYYSMQESIKLSAFVTLALGVATIFLGNSLASVAIAVIIFVFPVNIGSSLQTDESSKWNKFEITLPIRRKSILTCKYFSYLLLVMIGLTCSLVIVLLLPLFGHEVKIPVILFSYAYGLSLALFTGSLMYPFLLKIGAAKSDLIIIISAIGAVVLMLAIWLIMRQIVQGVNLNSPAVSLVTTIASLICFMLSYFVSIAIHSKKEF